MWSYSCDNSPGLSVLPFHKFDTRVSSFIWVCYLESGWIGLVVVVFGWLVLLVLLLGAVSCIPPNCAHVCCSYGIVHRTFSLFPCSVGVEYLTSEVWLHLVGVQSSGWVVAHRLCSGGVLHTDIYAANVRISSIVASSLPAIASSFCI